MNQIGPRLYAQLGLRIPGDLAVRLKRHCQESRQGLNATVAQALDEYLSRRKG
jgi:hypothetical protein